jgi:YD repeat-containing protein
MKCHDDAIHRLTAANGPWGSGSYSYDANGNRLTKTEGASRGPLRKRKKSYAKDSLFKTAS